MKNKKILICLKEYNTWDFFKEMIDALSNGEIDGIVDDEPAFGGTIQDPKFKIAFTVETKNAWGVAIQKDNFSLKEKIDKALNNIHQNRIHKKIWLKNFTIPYPKF